jgi:hypothetical protein
MTSRSNPLAIAPALDLHIEAWERDLVIAATESVIAALDDFVHDAEGFRLVERGARRFDLRLPVLQNPVAIAESLKDYADLSGWRCVLEIKGSAEKKASQLKQLASQLEQQEQQP